jgi:hypothetical protein
MKGKIAAKVFGPRNLALLLLAVTGILSCVPARAQGALTGADIISQAKELITQLENLGASVGGDVMMATNNAGTQVSTATDHLQTVLHDQLNVPVTQLAGSLRDDALLLSSLVTQTNLLIQHQRECLFAQADIFVAGINTAVAAFKSGVPFVASGGVTVTSFQFDGHHTPNIVPREGGPLVVSGFHLWTEVAPRVALTQTPQNGSQVLATLDPSRGADDNSYRIALEPTFITQNAGKCLYLQTTPRQKKRILGIPVGQEDLETLVIPICIPQTTTMKVRLTAQVTYDLPTDDKGPDGKGRPLDPYQNFRFDNAECNHTHSVSATRGWVLPQGYTILGIDSRRVEQRNDNNNIQFSAAGNSITAAGTQDSPSCFSVHIPLGPSIEKLDHTAIWSYDARPMIAGTAYPQQTQSSATDLIDVVLPATQLCTAITKLANTAGRKTSVSYTVAAVNSGNESETFSSPVYTTDDAANTFTLPPTTAFQGEFAFTGDYNPTPVAGKCQVCVTLTDVQQCGF